MPNLHENSICTTADERPGLEFELTKLDSNSHDWAFNLSKLSSLRLIKVEWTLVTNSALRDEIFKLHTDAHAATPLRNTPKCCHICPD